MGNSIVFTKQTVIWRPISFALQLVAIECSMKTSQQVHGVYLDAATCMCMQDQSSANCPHPRESRWHCHHGKVSRYKFTFVHVVTVYTHTMMQFSSSAQLSAAASTHRIVCMALTNTPLSSSPADMSSTQTKKISLKAFNTTHTRDSAMSSTSRHRCCSSLVTCSVL